MYKIRYAEINDAKVLGEIHSESWKAAYKGILPDSVLDNITADKREKYFEKALSENLEEDTLIFVDDKAVGLMTFGKCRDNDRDYTYGEIWGNGNGIIARGIATGITEKLMFNQTVISLPYMFGIRLWQYITKNCLTKERSYTV